jgi:hypothetical protein
MSSDYEALDRLLDAGDLDTAREMLLGAAPSDEAYAVLRIKLSLCDGSLEPALAAQRLIQLMRQKPDWPGAKALFQIATERAYEQRESSVSLSHVPPPVRPNS